MTSGVLLFPRGALFGVKFCWLPLMADGEPTCCSWLKVLLGGFKVLPCSSTLGGKVWSVPAKGLLLGGRLGLCIAACPNG